MRIGLFSGLALWLAPVLIAGGIGVGLPRAAAAVVGVAVAAGCALPLSKLLLRHLAPAFAASRTLAAAAGIFGLAAIAQIGCLSVFMADPSYVRCSMNPSDPFRRVHSCMTSYAEAVRFVAEGDKNIYDTTLYLPRFIGPLRVDPYHYPPPFLLLPQAVRVVAPDFVNFRALWFALQAAVLLGAVVAVAVWVGGAAGAAAFVGGAVLLSLPSVLFGLQQGNFQLTAAPLTVIACMLLASGYAARGAALLAYTAAAKIFPGIVVVYLVTARRWRTLVWIAAFGIGLLGLTLLAQGTRPTRDFFTHALPEISSGAAFPHTERRETIGMNWTAYGVTVRLRYLGVSLLDLKTGMRIAAVYGVMVILLAAWAGRYAREWPTDANARLLFLQVVIALMTLASFRSPFAGAPYGSASTVWLMTLLGAAAATTPRRWLWFAAALTFSCAIWALPSPAYPPTTFTIAASGLLFLAGLAVNVWAVVYGVRAGREVLTRSASSPSAITSMKVAPPMPAASPTSR